MPKRRKYVSKEDPRAAHSANARDRSEDPPEDYPDRDYAPVDPQAKDAAAEAAARLGAQRGRKGLTARERRRAQDREDTGKKRPERKDYEKPTSAQHQQLFEANPDLARKGPSPREARRSHGERSHQDDPLAGFEQRFMVTDGDEHNETKRAAREFSEQAREFLEQQRQQGPVIARGGGAGDRPDYRGQTVENEPQPKWRRDMARRKNRNQSTGRAPSGGGNYLDAHYARLALADKLSTDGYRRYLENYFTSGSKDAGEPLPAMDAEHYQRHLADTLERAETFTMSRHMHALVTATAGEMPDEPLRPEDLPSPEGFLWLPIPFGLYDLRGRVIQYTLVMWSVRGNTVGIHWFTDRNNAGDEINHDFEALERGGDVVMARQLLGRYVFAGFNPVKFGQTLPIQLDPSSIRKLDDYGVLPDDWRHMYDVHTETFLTDVPAEERVRYVVTHVDPETDPRSKPVFGELTDQQLALIQDAYDDMMNPPRYVAESCMKQLVCFWRMCQQTLAAREHHEPNRHLAKQLTRRSLAASPVTVITLRRRQGAKEGHREIEWDHRWVRRGHWRQQWYGPREGDRYQRAIYINPTICGPEDKPLIIRPHVNVLAR